MKHTAYVACLLLFLLLPFTVKGQQELVRSVQTADMLTFGNRSVYDTYLAPYVYPRFDLGYIHEQLRSSKSDKYLYQGMLKFNFAMDGFDNFGYMTVVMLNYKWGMYYKFRPTPKLQLLGGASAGGYIGGIYQKYNSNNPGQVKFNLGLSLSGMAVYEFKLWNQPFKARYQLNMPFLGATFSPHYGQSYYEIFYVGNTKDAFLLSSFHNTIEFENLLLIDIPISKITLRLGYANTFIQTRMHKLDTQFNTHSFLIGVVWDKLYLNKKRQPSDFRSPL